MKQITKSQRKVLDLLCQGLSNQEICAATGLSLGTVKVHLGNMHKLFKVKSRLQLVVYAYRYGLVEPQLTSLKTHGDCPAAQG